MLLKSLNLSHGDLSSANLDCYTTYLKVEMTKELSIIDKLTTNSCTKVEDYSSGRIRVDKIDILQKTRVIIAKVLSKS